MPTRSPAAAEAFVKPLAWGLLAVGVAAVLAFGVYQQRRPASVGAEAATDPETARTLRQVWQLLGGGAAAMGSDLTVEPERLSLARQMIDEVLAADPRSALGHRYLGFHQLASGQLDAAAGSMARSLELDPHSLDGELALGLVHTERQDYEAAEHAFRRAIALQPRSVAAHHNLGQVLWLQGRRDEAEQVYRRKIELKEQTGLYLGAQGREGGA